MLYLVGDSIDFGIVSCKTRGAHEFGHLLLCFDGINGRLERDHAGHDDAGAEQNSCCRPLQAARLGDIATRTWKQRRAFRFDKNHGCVCYKIVDVTFFMA